MNKVALRPVTPDTIGIISISLPVVFDLVPTGHLKQELYNDVIVPEGVLRNFIARSFGFFCIRETACAAICNTLLPVAVPAFVPVYSFPDLFRRSSGEAMPFAGQGDF